MWPDNFFTKLNDAVVWPVVSYGAAVWGFKSFSCMNAVHNRAMRYFLGVGKYTPNTALAGEMPWIPPLVRQWKTIALSWSRLSCSFQSRVNKRIALRGLTINLVTHVKNGVSMLQNRFQTAIQHIMVV